MSDSPTPTAANGRQRDGTFAPGNKPAQGNPFAKRVAELRQALFDAVTPDLNTVVVNLVEQAKNVAVSSL